MYNNNTGAFEMMNQHFEDDDRPLRSPDSTRNVVHKQKSQIVRDGTPSQRERYHREYTQSQQVRPPRNGTDSQPFQHPREDGYYTMQPGQQNRVRHNDIESDTRTHSLPREIHTSGLNPKSVPSKKLPGGKKFLRKVQTELEDQRLEWEDEVERLTGTRITDLDTLSSNAKQKGTNSFVDTSSGKPIFTAFVDVSDFPPRGITVSVDSLTSKVMVRAQHDIGMGTLTKTFTQKVQLPRFADEPQLISKLSKRGILKIEVPLIYYFPHENPNKGGRPAKSFVNEIKTMPDGTQALEILVNTGSDYRAKDLHIQVMDDKLVIFANKKNPEGAEQATNKRRIKEYTLPRLADLDRIKSKLSKDGRLCVTVPLKRYASSDGGSGSMSPASPSW